MGRQLTLELPDQVYLDLLGQAERAGLPLESLVEDWLARAAQEQVAGAGRLRDWAGAFQSGVPDAASRHRDYLGQALLDDRRVGPDE